MHQDKVINILRRYLGKNIEIHVQTTAAEIKGWDSITHMKILIAIEEEFGFTFSYKETVALKNVGDLIQLVQSKASA